MMTEDSVEEGEVVVVLPDRAVPADHLFPGAKPHQDNKPIVHKFEILAACVMGLTTLSGGVLEGFTSPILPTLLHPDSNYSEYIVNPSPLNTSDRDIQDFLNYNSTTDTSTASTYNLTPSTAAPTQSVDNLTVNIQEGPGVVTLNQSLVLTEEEASWLGSLLLLGACLGAMLSSWVISLGRRRAVLASAFPRLVGWIMIGAASDAYMMCAGRFLCGVSVGMVTSAAPVYISEVSHSSVRGALSCVVQLGVNMGIFIVALLGTFTEWRGLAAFGAVTVLVYWVCCLFIPDSPVWLVSRGQEEKARQALVRLRGPHYCIDYELQQIMSSKLNQFHPYSWWDIVTLRSCLMPLGAVVLVTLINRCSGYNAIISYCTTFFHQAVPGASEYWAATVFALMQVISTVIAAVFVDRLGRRKLLITSILAMGLSLAVISVCEVASSSESGGSWIAVLAAMVYVSAYSLGVGPITWVLVGEMFPQAAREKASAIIAVLNWFLAFVVTKTYFGIVGVTGIAGLCAIYASVCLVGLVLVYLLLPETKGRTLGEIEAYFLYTRNSLNFWKDKRDMALSSILESETRMTDTYSTFSTE